MSKCMFTRYLGTKTFHQISTSKKGNERVQIIIPTLIRTTFSGLTSEVTISYICKCTTSLKNNQINNQTHGEVIFICLGSDYFFVVL